MFNKYYSASYCAIVIVYNLYQNHFKILVILDDFLCIQIRFAVVQWSSVNQLGYKTLHILMYYLKRITKTSWRETETYFFRTFQVVILLNHTFDFQFTHLL